MSAITKALSSIQQTLNAPKNQYNSFGKYSYRNCEDILQAVKPLLGECSLTLNDEISLIGDRFYVKATAKLHLGEESIESVAFARETDQKKGMDAAQLTGATSSYARKYALNGLFAIDDNKDADSQDNRAQSSESDYVKSLKRCKTLDELKQAWVKIPKTLQTDYEPVKNQVKAKLGGS